MGRMAAICDQCGRQTASIVRKVDRPRPIRRFQFRLGWLLILVASACIVFALAGRFGVGGLMDRPAALSLMGCALYPLIELYLRWKEDDLDNI